MFAYIQYNTHAWETSWSHTQLTPKAALQALALGQVPTAVPHPQLLGALPCLRKVNLRWLFPSPLFFICTEMVKVSPARKKKEMRGTQPSGLRGSRQCMGETRTLSKAQEPSRNWEPGPQKNSRTKQKQRFWSCLALIVLQPFPPSSQPVSQNLGKARCFPGRAFFQVLLPCHLPGSPGLPITVTLTPSSC